VVVELAALPLVHTAYLTALLFTVANLALLRVRIRAEEAALAQWPAYAAAMEHKPSFVPAGTASLEPASAPTPPHERSRP
jgi:methyltransferase